MSQNFNLPSDNGTDMQIFFSITFAPFTRLALSRPFHVVEWFSPNKSLRVICVRQGKSVSHGHPLKYKVFHYPADPHNSHCYNDNDRLVPRTFFWSWEIKTSLFKVVVKIDMQFSDQLLRLPLKILTSFWARYQTSHWCICRCSFQPAITSYTTGPIWGWKGEKIAVRFSHTQCLTCRRWRNTTHRMFVCIGNRISRRISIT